MPTNAAGKFDYPEDNWAEGRMRKQGDPSEFQMAGWLDDLKSLIPGFGTRGGEAKPTPEPTRTVDYGAAKPMGEYPTDADAVFAKNSGFGYGTIDEPYITNQTAKVFGEVSTKTTKGAKGKSDITQTRFSAFSPEGQTVAGLMNHIIDHGKSVNIDLTKPEFAEVRNRIGHTYTKAAIAVEGNPVAKLGYDPSLITSDISGVKTNLSGAYTSPKYRGREGEGLYASLTDPSVLVHESIHRGLDKLAERNPEAQKLLDKIPELPGTTGHEGLVRYMMVKFAGDPEKFGPSGQEDKQRKQALDMLEDKVWGKQHKATIDKLMDLAAKEVAKKRPGGPR